LISEINIHRVVCALAQIKDSVPNTSVDATFTIILMVSRISLMVAMPDLKKLQLLVLGQLNDVIGVADHNTGLLECVPSNGGADIFGPVHTSNARQRDMLKVIVSSSSASSIGK
jgi:hypothetical protein